MTRFPRLLWCVPLASSLFACSSQVQSDYQGEPVATLRGKVVAKKASLESDVSAAIVWSTVRPEFFGERVDVQGSFPASFSLNLFEAPPAEAELATYNDYCIAERWRGDIVEGADCDGTLIPEGTGVGAWIGHIVAVDSSTQDGQLDVPKVVGADLDHFIVYFDHDDFDESDLPANPSAEQIARAMDLIDPDYMGPREAGFHLARKNPEYRKDRQKRQECRWEGLCVHWTTDQTQYQDQADWDFDNCTQRFPENPTCETFTSGLAAKTDDEPAASVACREQYASLDKNKCLGAKYGSAPSRIENPNDLDDPITIQLGMTFWDATWDWGSWFD